MNDILKLGSEEFDTIYEQIRCAFLSALNLEKYEMRQFISLLRV